MRADRLLSLVLLLQRGRMSAPALARELECSTRTVLRDVEALSAAGIPVYAERGRDGGFALLPGFNTDLTGLTHDEALALLVAGGKDRAESSGMAPALASAMRKVVAALPAGRRDLATRDAERILIRPEGWLPGRRGPEPTDAERLAVVRSAVFAGHRLRIRYATADGEPQWRTIDPVGLVNAAGSWYLLATRDGTDRTYRLSRMLDAQELDEPAARTEGVDLDRIWQERRARFFASMSGVPVQVRARARCRPDLVRAARVVTSEEPDVDGWLRLELTFSELGRAEGVIWNLGPDVEVLAPETLRAAIAGRAEATAARYRS